ncbi:hypothetical protein HZS_209 [Henneguya salminicola]|nr:hypothetical protein HZS_209 [Henneguya salminicola]
MRDFPTARNLKADLIQKMLIFYTHRHTLKILILLKIDFCLLNLKLTYQKKKAGWKICWWYFVQLYIKIIFKHHLKNNNTPLGSAAKKLMAINFYFYQNLYFKE